MSIIEIEERMAFLAYMVNLLLAANYGVLDAEIVVKTEARVAIEADSSGTVSELSTILDGLGADSSVQEVTLMKINVPLAQLRHAPRLSFSRQPIRFDS